MVRQQKTRRRAAGDPDQSEADLRGEPLPRRPAADTRAAGHVLERIRRLLTEARPIR